MFTILSLTQLAHNLPRGILNFFCSSLQNTLDLVNPVRRYFFISVNLDKLYIFYEYKQIKRSTAYKVKRFRPSTMLLHININDIRNRQHKQRMYCIDVSTATGSINSITIHLLSVCDFVWTAKLIWSATFIQQ